MHSIYLSLLLFFTISTSNHLTELQTTVPVKKCENVAIGDGKAFTDDIKNGVKIADLSWAWNSSVACFPETQKENYTGNHLLFETEIPANSEMTVTLIPKKSGTKLSLYGYQIGVNNKAIVPKLSSCVTCEADNNQAGRAKNNIRSIRFNAIQRPYKIMIGIAGVKGLTEGEFDFQILVKSR